MAWAVFFISLICSYLCGSINFAVIISKRKFNSDIRNYGSGNAGMTNMLRVYGVAPGIITFLLDTLKGVVVCLLARYLIYPFIFESLGYEFLRPEYGIYYCGVCCFIGHAFPVFFGFRGGKGVATSLGIVLVCEPLTGIVALAVFIIVMIFTRIVSLGSILAAVTLPVSNAFFAKRIGDGIRSVVVQCLLVSVITVLVIVMHRANIGRLIRGEEKKLSVKTDKKEE